jgi:hypothetical protein
VETWLDAHSVAILDRAHCCKQSRIRFDALVDGTCLRNVMPSRCGGRAGKIRNADNLIRWLQKMNMRVESFVVPCSLLWRVIVELDATGWRRCYVSIL